MKIRVNATQTVLAAMFLCVVGLAQRSAAAPVKKNATTTVVISSANPSPSGQLITFTATVKSVTGTPGGTVSFKFGSTLLCNFPISGGVDATCSTSILPVGTDTIKATYGGDANFSGSSATIKQKVTANQTSTTTAVTSSSPTAAFGQSVKFTASVSPIPADGEKVTFKNGTAALGTGVLTGGAATFTSSTLTVGSHAIAAVYGGDAHYLSSSGSASQVVQKTSTGLSISAPQATVGQPVKITANVASSTGATPTGSVTFKNGTVTLGHATLSGGGASITKTFTATGSYPIQATYSGGADFLASSGSGSVNVASSAAIVVNITNKTGQVSAGGVATTFNANVQNDLSNGGVTWTLTANAANCAPACGALSNGNSTSVTYTPPPTAPTGASASPTITATSVADATKSDSDNFSITSVAPCGTGNEAILKGQYAFLLKGFKSSGVNEVAGSFTADGAGKISVAEGDLNDLDHGPRKPIFTSSPGSYSVGSDNRGCLTFNTTDGSAALRFALGDISAGVAGKGRAIQFDPSPGSNNRDTGIFLKQDPTSFAAGISGNYAYGGSGQDSSGGRFMSVGAFTAGAGLFTNGESDVNDAGTTSNVTGVSGSYTTTVDSNGRGTGTLAATGQLNSHFAFYVVSSSEVIFVTTDVLGANSPIEAGELRLQNGTFTNASLHGPAVFWADGLHSNAVSADIGLLNADGSGNLTGTDYGDHGGTSHVDSVSGTYTVGSNGRVAINLGGPAYAYLTGVNAGFLLIGDSVQVGELEPQAAGPFSNASLSGTFFHGTYAVDILGSNVETGTAGFDGAGNFSATADQFGSDGLSTQTFTGTYLVNADGSGNLGTGIVVMVVSGNKVVFIDEGNSGTSATPEVTVVEK